jgi:capsular exopolysaccharide synthesis family protein
MFKKKTYTEEFSVRYSQDAPFEIVEAYNSLVSNLISVSAEEGSKSIAVTSAVYGEGKASLAINLAYALANNLLDKKILLIDTDLRTSKISEELVPNAKSGISNFLSADVTEPEIQKSELGNLDIIVAGNVKGNPTGLLRSDKMGSVLNDLEAKYDFIILDTAPINDYADALFLADRVAGYIVSAKKKVSSVSAIDVATTRIENSGSKVIGLVFAE